MRSVTYYIMGSHPLNCLVYCYLTPIECRRKNYITRILRHKLGPHKSSGREVGRKEGRKETAEGVEGKREGDGKRQQKEGEGKGREEEGDSRRSGREGGDERDLNKSRLGKGGRR